MFLYEKCPKKQPMKVKDFILTYGGIFTVLYNKYGDDIPWNINEFDASNLNTSYRYHSGEKTLVEILSKDIEDGNSSYVIDYIWTMLSRKWKRDYDTIFSDFNILDNVDMKYSEVGYSDSDMISNEKNSKKSKNYEMANESKTDFETNEDVTINNDYTSSTEKTSNKSENDEMYYGFNSDKSSPVTDNLSTEFNKNQTDEVNKSKSKDFSSSSKKDKVMKESSINDVSNTDTFRTDKNKKNTNKYNNENGRDGRYSPQKLSEEQLALNKKIFFDIVFDDIDRVLTIPCYV